MFLCYSTNSNWCQKLSHKTFSFIFAYIYSSKLTYSNEMSLKNAIIFVFILKQQRRYATTFLSTMQIKSKLVTCQNGISKHTEKNV